LCLSVHANHGFRQREPGGNFLVGDIHHRDTAIGRDVRRLHRGAL
jgi:hypothetical protein